eukprot:6478591-Amphidinium_carterae.1
MLEGSPCTWRHVSVVDGIECWRQTLQAHHELLTVDITVLGPQKCSPIQSNPTKMAHQCTLSDSSSRTGREQLA